ncbi:putative secreted protein (Por secretion system target) [Spirosoma oryzae]|uniref:Putative secreted protein (Por secretion system target) n=1 Tax=Spirosoma oryzae TaxID=1469603 RepID=A0A2T0T5L6_9BACT|nr:S8 family serine peptidase [Spirosoma oryzae]PRY40962.1 putative secreted protein (Por secretion system target) [Spirosoma oryzae]
MYHVSRRFYQCLLTFGLTLSSFMLLAQPRPLTQYSDQQQRQQIGLQKTLSAVEQANYQQALTVARQRNQPITQQHPDGTVTILSGITERGELLYKRTYSATQAGLTTRTNSFYNGGSLGLSLSGSTLTGKLGIWDGGRVRSTHVEFRNSSGASRVTQIDNSTSLNSHSTHVAGIMVAAGVNPRVKGMANATDLRAYDFSSDVSEMTTAAPNLLVSNHSYGFNAGWVYDDSRTTAIKWEWWGDTTISRTEDYKFGLYDSQSRAWDQIAYNSPYYLIVKSAGNSHGDNGPGPGQPYYLGNDTTRSVAPRKDQNGYDQIATNGGAKNILSVAAVGILSDGYNQPADVVLGDFSSWGPTDDGRIKPDIAGVGVGVLSSSSETDSAYITYSGTSMSSPNVAGSLLLAQELYAQRNSGKFLRSSTLRGLALHTADEAGTNPGPDYQFGWGLLNMEKLGRVLLNTNNAHLMDERTLAQGGTYSLTVVASGRGPLTTSIAWTDPAGTAITANSSGGILNNRSPRLVNDLDIRVSNGTTTTLPWTLDPANPTTAAARGDNIRDNYEQVLVSNPVPGQAYTVTVSHKGTLTGNTTSTQDYALLISGIGGTAYCASAPSSSAGTRIDRVQFNTINQAGSTGCTTYTDNTQVSTVVQPGQTLPLSVTTGTCGASANVVVKAFADWNQDGDFNDANELLATSPVLNGSTSFSTPVTIPASATVGQYVRMRLVAVETSSPDAVSACGSYGAGETQDYVLQTVQVANNVGIVSLVSPADNFCSQYSNETTVAVRVRNYGSAAQQNVPVTVRIVNSTDGTEVTSLTSVIASLPAFTDQTVSLPLPATVSLTPGQTYQFQLSIALANDLIPDNNTLQVNRTATNSPNDGIFSATRCGTDGVLSLINRGGNIAYWYDAPTGGNLIAAGNQTSTTTLPASGTLYAGLNDFSSTIGPATKSVFGGGSYSGNFGPAPLISTTVPIQIESARLYIGSAGKLTFTVQKLDNTPVSSVTIDVTPTRNQSLTATTNGQLVDDPNDQGAVYPINLSIPAAGDYKIAIGYADGASIFRSNAGNFSFPYQIKTQSGTPIVSINGASFDNNGTIQTLTTAWYYFYGMRVRALSCPSAQRTPVTPTAGTAATASVTADGSTTICQGGAVVLRANTGTDYTYQWYRNGTAISGATASTLTAGTAGSYTVQVSNNCLPVRSSAITVSVRNAVTPVVTANGFVLTANVISNIQWLMNGVAITGANSATYVVTQTGRYAVRGSVNGCGEMTSEDVYLTILADEPLSSIGELLVYPNPASRQVTIKLTTDAALKTLPTARLVDLQGRTLRLATLQRSGTIYTSEVDVSALSAGTVIVIITDDQNRTLGVQRLTKQ